MTKKTSTRDLGERLAVLANSYGIGQGETWSTVSYPEAASIIEELRSRDTLQAREWLSRAGVIDLAKCVHDRDHSWGLWRPMPMPFDLVPAHGYRYERECQVCPVHERVEDLVSTGRTELRPGGDLTRTEGEDEASGEDGPPQDKPFAGECGICGRTHGEDVPTWECVQRAESAEDR